MTHPSDPTFGRSGVLALLRTEPELANLTDEALLAPLEADPMLPARIGVERYLMNQVPSPPPPPPAQPRRRFESSSLPPQHPLFGLSLGRVAEVLDPGNWQRAAVLRREEGRDEYRYLHARTEVPEVGGRQGFTVERVLLPSKEHVFQKTFHPDLEEALTVANRGEACPPGAFIPEPPTASLLVISRPPR